MRERPFVPSSPARRQSIGVMGARFAKAQVAPATRGANRLAKAATVVPEQSEEHRREAQGEERNALPAPRVDNFVAGIQQAGTWNQKEDAMRNASRVNGVQESRTRSDVATSEREQSSTLSSSTASYESSNRTERKPSNKKALIKAAKSNNANQATLSLQNDPACIDSLGMWGNTPLITACQYGSAQVAQLLIKHGANASLVNEHGCSALHFAALEGMTQEVESMLTALKPLEKETITRPASMYNSRTDQKTCMSPLMAASANGYDCIVKLLITHGVYEESNLERAFACALKEGYVGVVATVLEGEHPVIRKALKKSPLFLSLACSSGKKDLVLALLQGKPDEIKLDACSCVQEDSGNNQNSPHYSPLSIACGLGNHDIVEILLSAGADPNYYCKLCSTPLMQACRANSASCVAHLLKGGAERGVSDAQSGMTPLEYATNATMTEIVQLLAVCGD